jgi:hypothetical protein
MKKVLVILAALALLPVASAMAGPIVGQQVVVDYGPYHSGDGGEFSVTGPGYSFLTFCVETNEYFNPGNSYYIGSITEGADYNGNPPNPVPLTPQVAYLYTQFMAGDLSGYDYTSDTDAGLLQSAIWEWMGEVTADPTNPFYNLAGTAVSSGAWSGLGNVAILNLWADPEYTEAAQDQLTLVPEPTSMLLIGTGLIGLAAAVRRRRQR